MKNRMTLRRSVLLVVILAVIASYPFLVNRSSYYLSIAIEIGIMAIYAMSYDILMGYTGIVSFGHSMFFGLGAYTTGILMKNHEVNFVFCCLIVFVICVALALLIGMFSLRIKSTYFSIMTLSMSYLFYSIATKWRSVTHGDDGFVGIPFLIRSKFYMFFVVWAIVLIVYILAKKFTTSPTGKVLQAIRENEMRTGMVGYNVLSYKLISLSFSAIMAGFSGALYATYLGTVHPTHLSTTMNMQAIFMTVLGGAGTLYGSIIGSLIYKLVSVVIGAYTNYWQIAIGISFVLCVMFLPGGLASVTKIKKSRRPNNNIFLDTLLGLKKLIDKPRNEGKQ